MAGRVPGWNIGGGPPPTTPSRCGHARKHWTGTKKGAPHRTRREESACGSSLHRARLAGVPPTAHACKGAGGTLPGLGRGWGRPGQEGRGVPAPGRALALPLGSLSTHRKKRVKFRGWAVFFFVHHQGGGCGGGPAHVARALLFTNSPPLTGHAARTQGQGAPTTTTHTQDRGGERFCLSKQKKGKHARSHGVLSSFCSSSSTRARARPP